MRTNTRRTMGFPVDLGQMLEGLCSIAWSASPDGRVDCVNRRWSAYTGVGPHEVRGFRWRQSVHADDLADLSERWAALRAFGGPGEISARLRGADGRYRRFTAQISPIRDHEQRIVRWWGICNEADDLRRSQQDAQRRACDRQPMVDSVPAHSDAVPGFIIAFAASGELAWLNRYFSEYLGWQHDASAKRTLDGSIHADDLPQFASILASAFASGTGFEFECRVRRRDGVYRWFYCRGVPAHDAAGNVTGWHALLTDIDDRKQAEMTLAASERHLNEIINAIPAQVWSARTDGGGDFFNQFYLDYVGRSIAQVRDFQWTGAIHPDDLAELLAVWRASLSAGAPGVAEARMRGGDGRYRWFLFCTSPLRDDDGQIVKWYGVNIDIDDRKRAEEELRRSKAFLAEGQRLAGMGNFWWQVTGEIAWSEQLYRIFEFEPGSTVTLDRIVARYHPEDVALATRLIEQAQRGDCRVESQYRLLMPDQSVKHVQLVAHRAADSRERIEYIGTALDVTHRRRSEEALDKARSELAHVARSTSLGTLAASIAHEVNQPLSGIVTNASTGLRMLAAEPPDLDGARETVRRTLRDGNRAAEVIARLRALFSKRSATIEAVDLNAAAREVIALMQSDLERARIVLRTEFADALPLAGCDRVQIQQVIMNLVRNAVDAMRDVDDRPRQMIVATGQQADAMIRLSVHDSGIGFDPQNTQRLFDTFYTTSNDGMGIGLAVSRSIVESHRGRLSAALSNDGPGAIFAFTIPVYDA